MVDKVSEPGNMAADRHSFFGFSKFKDKVSSDAETNAKFKELMDEMMK